MKTIKRLVIAALLIFLSLLIINKETDWLSAFPERAPAISARFPGTSQRITELSEQLSVLTDPLPSFEQLIAILKNEEIPIDPEDVAHNAYISDSPMLMFYPDENAAVTLEDGRLSVFGVMKDKSRSHLILQLNTPEGEEVSRASLAAGNDGLFKKEIKLPRGEAEGQRLEAALYTGNKAYGEFQGWIGGYLFLEWSDGRWALAQSPVYASNKAFYERDKSINDALRSTTAVNAKSYAVSSIAQKLTEDKESDYDKILAIHDWVCSYLYYDQDSIDQGQTADYTAGDVLNSRKAVCLGYANLFAALSRSVGIPCNVVSGYALGVGEDRQWTQTTIQTTEANHAWTEAYADGRWIIIDPTWDSMNRYEDGEFHKETRVSHLYFDANLQFFSGNHKIIEYMRGR